MFNCLMTYIRVTPLFLEFVFPFGKQHYVTDFHFSGFRNSSFLREDDGGVRIPQLSLSGRYIELCYSLKSVESYEDPERPWSIRQCSIHHTFDLETRRTTWITVKGNELMKDLLSDFLKRSHSRTKAKAKTSAEAFKDTLAVHLLLLQWSRENWGRYINFLETSLHQKTRRNLSIPVDQIPRIPAVNMDPTFESMTALQEEMKSPSGGFFRAIPKAVRRLMTLQSPKRRLEGQIPHDPVCPGEAEHEALERFEKTTLSTEDMQHVHFVEQKAAEALQVLKANGSTLNQLKNCYVSLTDLDDLCVTNIESLQMEVKRFAARVDVHDAELGMQQSRIEALVRLTGERKAFVCKFMCLKE